MSTNEEILYFVVRGERGEVTHLVRTIQSEKALIAEYCSDGYWHADPSAFAIADDGSYSKWISEAEALQIVDEQRTALSEQQQPQALIRDSFATYFMDCGLAISKPIPSKGTVSGSGWDVQFVFNDNGNLSTLEFLAYRSTEPPIRGRIHADGSAETLESFIDTFYVDPSLSETDEKGLLRMQEHNDRVTEELRAVGLL
jgi:hypothetical protein